MMFFNHSKCFSWIWGGFIRCSDVTPTVSGPGGDGDLRISTSANELPVKPIAATLNALRHADTADLMTFKPNKRIRQSLVGKIFVSVPPSQSADYHLSSVQNTLQYSRKKSWPSRESLCAPSVGENE